MKNHIPTALQEFLDVVNQLEMPNTPKEARERSEAMSKNFAITPVFLPLVDERNLFVDNLNVPVRIYHPSPEKTLPLIIYIHGGGHVIGSLNSYDALCRQLAMRCHCVVMSIGYRLAPEHPYPSAIEDCLQVINQRQQILKDLHVDSDTVFLIGDSAGGNLALTTVYRLNEPEKEAIKALVLIYPSVDFTMQSNSIDRYGTHYLLTKERIHWFFNHYFAAGGDRTEASPLFFNDFKRFPPLFMALAEFDPLVDEGRLFAQKIKHVGGQVQVEVFQGMIHGFAQLYTIVPQQVLHLLNSIRTYVMSLNN